MAGAALIGWLACSAAQQEVRKGTTSLIGPAHALDHMYSRLLRHEKLRQKCVIKLSHGFNSLKTCSLARKASVTTSIDVCFRTSHSLCGHGAGLHLSQRTTCVHTSVSWGMNARTAQLN